MQKVVGHHQARDHGFKHSSNDDGCFENYESDKQHSPVQTGVCLGDDTTEAYNTKEVEAQIHSDEALARKIQFEVDVPTIEIGDERIGDEHEKSSEPSQCSSPSLPKLVKQMEKQVDKTGQFFLLYNGVQHSRGHYLCGNERVRQLLHKSYFV